MEAPTLERSPRGLLVKFKPPRDPRPPPGTRRPPAITHAAIHVYRGGPTAGAKHFLDVKPGGNEGTLLPPGQSGATPEVHYGEDGVHIVGGLHADDQEYKATVCYRRAADFSFGPESPLSACIKLCAPPKPCAPFLEPQSSSDNTVEVLVSYAAPARCSGVCLKFVDGANEYHVADDPRGGRYLVPGTPDPLVAVGGRSAVHRTSGHGSMYVKVPSKDVEYAVSVAAFNGFWSDFSAPTTIKVADHAPAQCCAPLVESPTEDGVTVMFTLPPKSERARMVVMFDTAADGKKYWDNQALTLVDNPPTFKYSVATRSITVKCLAAKTEYEVSVAAMNEHGIGQASPATKFKTLPSEVELLGTETQEDRDVELRKRAVDVENADPSPAKKGKSG
mmetsp:Transcript_26912/g.80674  ORF Transcript_26912/g.80674 Transcript_26912/m.80674 type:complete len:391 (+) Transcript_26912:196-1368(+)